MKRLYFDYNASAPLADGLEDQVAIWLRQDSKNPSSAHADGRAARTEIQNARRTMNKCLGATPQDKLVFTSGGTEANNMVIRHCAHAGEKILISSVEHSSIYKTCLSLQNKQIVLIPVSRSGVLDLDFVKSELSGDVALLAVMLANNETGFIFNIPEVVQLARVNNIPTLVDAVCAVGKWPIQFSELGCDYLTFSSHKFGGFKGVGGVLARQRASLTPFITGGPHELGMRAGTENVLGILSSAFALERSLDGLDAERVRQEALRARLKRGIQDLCAEAHFLDSDSHLSQTLAFSVGWAGHVLLTALDLAGVSASFGSACASGALETSRILRTLCKDEREASEFLRLSFGRSTSAEDIEDFLQRLKEILEVPFNK